MNRILFFLLSVIGFCASAYAQNVGIGTTEPLNKMHIVGNLLVNTPTTATGTPPVVAQTKTMVNASTITFLNTDSTGRIYDPGGPSGNYNASNTANASIAASTNVGFEVTAETMDLNTGDSLIIKESSSGATLLAVGNGYTNTGKWVFNFPSLYLIFKSNADANTGAGFSLLFRRLYNNSSVLPAISGFAGNAFYFDAKTGSLRSGLINNSGIGNYSAAMGYNTTASGIYSTAMGYSTDASGAYSTALGENTTASGGFSTALGSGSSAGGFKSSAMGYGSSASGDYSTSMGFFTTASGFYSTAMGYGTTASGYASTAMGNFVSTNNQEGCFVIGDNSTTTVMNSPAANNFRARFDNGYRLYTSSNYSTGCSLNAGDNAWTTGSDARTKENFAAVNGEDFLKKIAGFHLTSWNYKTQNPKTFRHYGPMAQDFYAAFGKDKYGTIGNDTTINSADFAGVSFVAIQALEKRTALQQQEVEENVSSLKKEIEALKAIIQNQQKQIDDLKALAKSSAGQQQLIELMQKEIELLKRK